MKIILIKEVKKLGNPGDVVNVSPGYARNFLLNKGLAREATPARLAEAGAKAAKKIKEKNIKNEAREKERRALMGASILVRANATEAGVLFAGVGAELIARAIAKRKKLEINPKRLEMPHNHLKALGQHQVVLNLGAGEKIEFTVDIQREDE